MLGGHQNLFTASTQAESTVSEHGENQYPSLKNIQPSEKFKCFLCLPKSYETSTCQVCKNSGFIYGDDPMISLVQKIIQMELTPKQQRKDYRKEVSVHLNFVCDGCQMDPIQGIRYSCKQCNDYDLCESCYKRKRHKHKRFQKIGKNGYDSNSPTKKKLTQAIQKQKLLGITSSLIYKITQLK